jgi:peptidylprolyl isomerase
VANASKGDTVRVHYTGRLDDETVFDSSEGRDPLEFTVGAGQVIPGFDEAVQGMSPGDSTTVKIPSGEAYGEYRDDLVLEVGRDQFPPHMQPEEGQQLELKHPGGDNISVTVTDVSGDSIRLDANHPLAGQDLTFKIDLVEIVLEDGKMG